MDWGGCLFEGDVAQIGCIVPLFARLISVASFLAAMIFFVMLIVGGFRYLFSGGNAKATDAARGTLTAGILGMVLIISAYLILLVIARFTGVEALLQFELPQF